MLKLQSCRQHSLKDAYYQLDKYKRSIRRTHHNSNQVQGSVCCRASVPGTLRLPRSCNARFPSLETGQLHGQTCHALSSVQANEMCHSISSYCCYSMPSTVRTVLHSGVPRRQDCPFAVASLSLVLLLSSGLAYLAAAAPEAYQSRGPSAAEAFLGGRHSSAGELRNKSGNLLRSIVGGRRPFKTYMCIKFCSSSAFTRNWLLLSDR